MIENIHIDHEGLKKHFKTSFDEEYRHNIKIIKDSFQRHIERVGLTEKEEINDNLKQLIFKSIHKYIRAYNRTVLQVKKNNNHSLLLRSQVFLLPLIVAYIHWLNELYSVEVIQGTAQDGTHFKWIEKRKYYLSGNDGYVALDYKVVGHSIPLVNGKPNKRFFVTNSKQIFFVDYDVFDRVLPDEELKTYVQ